MPTEQPYRHHCGATKKNGEQCRALVPTGQSRCWFHGGPTVEQTLERGHRFARLQDEFDILWCQAGAFVKQIEDMNGDELTARLGRPVNIIALAASLALARRHLSVDVLAALEQTES